MGVAIPISDAEVRRLEDSPNRSDPVSDCQQIVGTKIDGQPQGIISTKFAHNEKNTATGLFHGYKGT